MNISIEDFLLFSINNIFDNQAKTILFSQENSDNSNILSEKIDFTQSIPEQIIKILYRNSIASVIIEGGKQTLQSFIDSDLWDEARVFKSRNYLNDGVKAPLFPFVPLENKCIGDDELLIFQHD